MNELSKLLQENLNIEFISETLSKPKNKDGVQKENLQSWILAVVNLISHLPCIITCMN